MTRKRPVAEQTVTAPIDRRLPPHTSRVSWVSEAQYLYEHRGEWMLLTKRGTAGAASTMAFEINRGRLWAFQPAGDFEAYADRKTHHVYVRYLGDGALSAPWGEGW